MATIIDDKNLTDDLDGNGVIVSSDISSPNNVRFTFTVANGSDANSKFKVTYKVNGAKMIDPDSKKEVVDYIPGDEGVFSVNYLAINGTTMTCTLKPEIGTNDADVTVTTVES